MENDEHTEPWTDENGIVHFPASGAVVGKANAGQPQEQEEQK